MFKKEYLFRILGLLLILGIAVSGILIVFNLEQGNRITGSFVNIPEQIGTLVIPLILIILVMAIIVIFVCKSSNKE